MNSKDDWLRMLQDSSNSYNLRLNQVEARLALLEAFRDKEAVQTKMKEQAAQQQAQDNLYAPLRNDTRAVLNLAAFARRLLQMDDLGLQCSALVRDAAREALGMKKVES